MSSTQVLLSKIAALRQRLSQAAGLARDADSVAASVVAAAEQPPAKDPLQLLERKVAAGTWQTSLLDGSFRQLPGAAQPALEPAGMPRKLTARGARLLQQARDLLHELRRLADEPFLQNPADALAHLHRETAAMIDAVLRIVQTFPEAPSAQVRLCDGLEVVLTVVGDRLARLSAGLENRRREYGKVDALADLLEKLDQGKTQSLGAFLPLTEKLLEEAEQGLPLHFFKCEADRPARFIACHGLVVAQVMARLIRTDPEWNNRVHEAVQAALLHDVGMLRVPVEILGQDGPLNDAQRRHVENHPTASAEILARIIPSRGWLIEAAAGHHERMDGTGYPAGLRDVNLSPLVRLLTVCDIYAALCCPRPYRPALETRTALTDTLLLAEQGALDPRQAERLLELSFFPVGSVVELADGAIGVVVATHPAKKDLHSPARPILAMLTDSQGQPVPFPAQLDQTQNTQRSILRGLPQTERQELLGALYPELVN